MRSTIEQTFVDGKGWTVAVDSSAPAPVVWRRLAAPAAWPAWAPHVRAVRGGDHAEEPETMFVGQRLVIDGPGPVAVRAEVTRLDPGRRWDFLMPLPGFLWALSSAHEVVPDADGWSGCRVLVHLRVSGPAARLLERTALAAYVPLAHLSVRRLARLAERDA